MAKKKSESAKNGSDGDTDEDAGTPEDAVEVALKRLRRAGYWRLLMVSILLIGVGAGLGFEFYRLRSDVSGLVDRIGSVVDRQESGFARAGDQTAAMRAGLELQRDDLIQIKRQLERLSRQ